MFTAAILGVLAAMALAVARCLIGPTAFDRLLAANAIGTSAILLLALFGFLTDRPEFLDIGITYALLNVIAMLAVLKFFRYGALGHEQDPEKDPN
ncbi:monovalent cation/H+ antiporter complex subunit F [Paralimibaculum aggregatum]|uniref:Monovalent cation/H+ antiporter complex subunit F n=1 Tax=Paralimibaculum aggregatum TaxID=3036245 RepID=A0ABQ6LMX8_9RHOB|nr:monovalent cation/H+ antiporter complex subunit F [Limibaculum sp. NKW23]GMG84342.1 monovalent cation/H+ antiporter complex subunit F [Limibaculum sp. NKW23]